MTSSDVTGPRDRPAKASGATEPAESTDIVPSAGSPGGADSSRWDAPRRLLCPTRAVALRGRRTSPSGSTVTSANPGPRRMSAMRPTVTSPTRTRALRSRVVTSASCTVTE